MGNQLNVPVTDIVAKLTQVNKNNGNIQEVVYQDDTWNVQVALTNGNGVFGALAFKAQFIYKNGKTGENIIQMNGLNTNVPGTVAGQSNPEIHIRKDLLEKMESIAKGFYTSKFESKSNTNSIDMGLIWSALLRHYDELPNEFETSGLTPLSELGKQFVQSDIASGALHMDRAHDYSEKLEINYRIKNSYINILRDTLKELHESGNVLDENIKWAIVQDVIAANLDLKETIRVLVKNLKFLLEAHVKSHYGTPDLSRLQRNIDKTLGYVIYNKSKYKIPYYKLSYKTGEKIGRGVIPPNDYGILSCAETAMLLSDPTINCKTSNAIVTASSRKVTNKLEWRNNFITRRTTDNEYEFRHKDITSIPADRWESFIDLNDFIQNTVDEILSLVFMGDDAEIGVKTSLYVLEQILKNRGCDTQTIDAALGVSLTQMLEINGHKLIAEVTTKRNGQKDVKVKPQQSPQKSQQKKQSLLSMFKR